MDYYVHVNKYKNIFNSTYYSAFINCLAQSNIFFPCNCWHCLWNHVRRNSCDSLPTVLVFSVINMLSLIGPVGYMQTYVTLNSTLTHELSLSFLKLNLHAEFRNTFVCSFKLANGKLAAQAFAHTTQQTLG